MKMATFTALNGGSPKATEDVNGNMTADVRRLTPPEEKHLNGQTTPVDPKPAGELSTSQGERDGWAGPGHDRPPDQPANYPNVEGSHKRKRSGSPEPRREAPAAAERSDEVRSQRTHSEPRDRYTSPRRDYRPYGDERREQNDSWPPRHVREDRGSAYGEPQPAAPNCAGTDEQGGEILRRPTTGQQMDPYEYANTSPDGDDRSVSMYSSGQYTPEQRRDGVIQMDLKKRKRNFSNRTKTGCLTCRRRKKKCDEAKPECSNCVRGTFVCAGYPPQRGAWQKPEMKPSTIQIESKDPSYVPPGAYGMPQQNPYGNQGYAPQKREPLPSYRGQPLRIDPPQGRPLQTDDDRATASTIPSASVASPDNKLSALSAYTNTTANVFPTPVSAAPVTAFSDRTPKEYQRVAPLHDLGRTEPEHVQRENTLPQINIFHAGRTTSPPGSQPPSSSGVQVTAALALSHTQFPSSRPRREKDEMLSGRPYYPFDKELVLERERCSTACWRFNNSSNPSMGVSPQERTRLFREILQPRDGVQLSPAAAVSPSPSLAVAQHAGRVGDETVVEAPFTCDYGYNLHIGKNVYVQRGCTVLDCCEVRIGDNVTIGPNVSIYTATLPTDPRRRGGSKGLQYGKPVVIEDDVFIGGNVIILPGVTIGKGSTVGAGSVVSRSVRKYIVCYGDPAKVARGIEYV